MLQEAMKRISKQKSQPCEVHNKNYNNHVLHIFNLIPQGNHLKKLKMSGEIAISLGPSCILQTVPTWARCKCWQRRRWTKLFAWNV